MKNNWKMTLMTALALLACGGLLLTGCESDTVAPQDELPALTQDDVGYQAAGAAALLAGVAIEIVEFTPTKDAYSYSFDGTDGITGDVNLEYWTGGDIDGDPSTFNLGDYARMWTPNAAGVVLETGEGGSVSLSFDIEAEVVQTAPTTATIVVGSSGTFASGGYSGTFDIENIVVTDGLEYPTSGSMTFSSSGFEMVITFDGTNMALISIDGEGTWLVDLSDGTRTDLPT